MLAKTVNFDIKDFKQLDRIGKGAFSQTYKIENKKTRKIYAAKIFRDLIEENTKDYSNILRQVSMLLKISHPAIIKIYGICPYDFNNEKHPIILSQFMKNGSLERTIDEENMHKTSPSWNPTKKLINIFGIASAMQYLHSNNILYRDLKPSNILEDDNFYPKVCDFDFSNFITNSLFSNRSVGTPLYTAPEIAEDELATIYSDVFSFAMTVYFLLTGRTPNLGNMSVFKHFQHLLRGERPVLNESINESYRKLITKCWSQEATSRPTFDEIVFELKNDRGFLTDEIDENEYFEYIKLVESGTNKSDDNSDNEIENTTFSEESYEKVNEKPLLIEVDNILNLKKDFEKTELINSGGYGEVYKIIEKSSGNLYAAKIAKDLITEEDKDKKIGVNLSREILILSKLSHPSIIKFVGYSATNFDDLCKPVLITNYYKNKSLADVIEVEKSGVKIPFWDDTLKLIEIYGVAKTMSFLHSKNILHRDLKPQNVLLDEYLFPKLGDFGFSKYISEKQNENEIELNLFLSEIMGTLGFIAPEIWQEKMYTKAADVYSFGMFLYQLLTYESPFHNKNTCQVCYSVAFKKERPPLTNKIPIYFKELIMKCWTENPCERPSFDEIVNIIETDERFIENVNKKAFNEYIEFIKKKQENEQKIKPSDQFKKISLELFYKEFNNTKFDLYGEGSLNIFDYVTQSEIYSNKFSSFYDVVDKITGQVCSAEISNFDVQNLSKKEISNLAQEVAILYNLKHPAIQQFIGYSSVDFNNRPKPVIVREHTKNFTLFNLLENNRKSEKELKLSETKKLILIYGIASGMSYLHSHDVIHHDLNSKNIFLDEKLNPKISEFGFFIKPQNSQRSSSQSMRFVNDINYYLAPEVLQSVQDNKKSDVYSFAFVVFEILSNEIPFENIKDQKQLFTEVINKCHRPSLEKIPQRYRKLISSCWSQNSDERPNFNSIVGLLRNDKKFINDEIDGKEYLDYIEFIDESNFSYTI